MLERTLQAGSIPVLQAVMRFAGQRQRLLANNIANITTPNYQMRDVSPQGFQRALERVAEKSSAGTAPAHTGNLVVTRDFVVIAGSETLYVFDNDGGPIRQAQDNSGAEPAPEKQ